MKIKRIEQKDFGGCEGCIFNKQRCVIGVINSEAELCLIDGKDYIYIIEPEPTEPLNIL